MLELFLLLLAISLLIGLCGRKRKFGFWGYFFCSLAFSPLIGVVVLLASDQRKV